MPPGKKPTSARASKSKQSDIELSLDDQNNTVVLKLENKDQELETQREAESSSEPKVKEEDEEAAAQQINKEIITNSMEEVEGTVVDSKEEATNVEAVIADHVNVESVEQSRVVEEEGERMEGLDKSDDANMEDDDDAIEGKTVDDEQKQKEGIDGVPVAEQHSSEEEIAAAQINDAEALEDNSNVLVLNEGRDGEGEGEGDGKNKEGNEIDEHPAEFIHNHITDRKKEKDLEIFIGRLDKEVVEDDLIKVFGKFGEIREAKIVRKSTTNKSKGFAFIRYATVEQAKNALSASKDGIEVRGKHVKMSASEGNDTLYMGNICKSWTKERVLGALKSYGIENIVEMHLPDDPRKGGKIKGFALLEFSTHSDAMEAIQRLRKPDVVFGRDISAKVAFAQTPLRPNQDVLSELKTVYLEGLTDDWNKGKVNELCKQYGELVEIKLSRNIGTKSKDFGFITFTSQEGALACVEGINNAHIGEEVKVKASIAKPHSKGQLQKQDTHGSFKVKEKGMAPSTKEESERENKAGSSKMGMAPSTKEESERENKAGSSKMKGHAKSKQSKRKGKTVAEDKGKTLSESEIGGGGKPKKSRTVTEDQPKLERKNRKRKNLHLNAEGRGKIGAEHGHNKRPSKKPQGNKERESKNFRKPKRDPYVRKGPDYGADFTRHRNSDAPGPAVSYQSHAYNTVYGYKRPHADMEPHAGYIEPVAQKRGRTYSEYTEPPVRMQYQPHVEYLEHSVGTQSRPHRGYHEPPVGTHGRPHGGFREPALGLHSQPHAGYLEPAVRRQGQSHAGYFESAAGKHGHDPYALALRRAGERDGHGSGHSASVAGSSRLPPPVPNYTSYAAYEGGSSVGSYYQGSRVHLPAGRAYH
ncbi:hypothetical protein CsSME_00029038 [Camellia sinensis var. sinensis]